MSQHLFPVTPVNLSLKSCNWRCNIPFMLSIGGRYFFPPLPDTLEIPWIFFLPYWVLFHFFGQPCDYPIHLLSWVSGHSLNHQWTCCKNFAALYTRFFWLCDITWIFSWFLTVGIKITLLHHWLVKWPHSGWVNTVVWRRRRDTCQYSKQIVSTDVHTLLYHILWRLVDHISWNCLYFRISIHIVLVETQHTQATAQVTLSFTTLHFFESVEQSQTAPTHFLFLK